MNQNDLITMFTSYSLQNTVYIQFSLHNVAGFRNLVCAELTVDRHQTWGRAPAFGKFRAAFEFLGQNNIKYSEQFETNHTIKYHTL